MNVHRSVPLNKLLGASCSENFDLIAWRFHRVSFSGGRVLHHSRMPIDNVYFIESGLVAVTPAPDAGHDPVCAWLIGNEGLAGLPVVLGAKVSPHRRMAITDVTALRISSTDLRELMSIWPKLRSELLLYVHRILIETAQTCACNARHCVTSRLARLLLSTADHLGREEFETTHRLLAQMLGTRRATVTDAIEALERQNIISPERGQMKITDRMALARVSCACYETVRRAQIPGEPSWKDEAEFPLTAGTDVS